MAAASFMSRFLNTTRTAIKFKDLVAYGIAHRAEITTHAISLIELLTDVFLDPACQAQFNNAIAILKELQNMPSVGLVKLFNRRGEGLDTLLESKPDPVDFEFFARIIPSFISWIRVQIKQHGTDGPAMLSALTITANLAQRHLSVIIGHYDAFVALLKGHKIDSNILGEAMAAARKMKASVEERVDHLRRRLEKTTFDAYGPQCLIESENLVDDGPVLVPTPTPKDMKSLIARLNSRDYGIDVEQNWDTIGETTDNEKDPKTSESSSSSSSSSVESASSREQVIDTSTPEPERKRPRRNSRK